MIIQKVLVILKPDCLERGLEEEVMMRFAASGLHIQKQERRRLKRDEVARLYKEHAGDNTFQVLVEYMLSGPCLILLVSGFEAVGIISRLKGRTGSGKGIRGQYAENFIRNIIHSAETPFKTGCEIGMFFEKEEIQMQQNKVIFSLSGMSECGKSTAGIYFDAHGIKRLKIIKILELVGIDHDPSSTASDFIDKAIKERPDWLRQAFADKLLEEMDRQGIRFCSLESMGDPETVKYMRARFPGEFFSVYIDATLEKRLQLQMIRKDLTDIEAAKAILLPKDEFKMNFWKMPDIKEIADAVIDNNGTLLSFQSQLDSLIAQHIVP